MKQTIVGIEFGPTIKVAAWEDASLHAPGHDVRSPYVERYWLPVLGPSTTFLLRYLAGRIEQAGGACAIDVREVARSIGLGERIGRNAPLARSLARAIDFEMARVTSSGTFEIRKVLPPLLRRHWTRLPDPLCDEIRRIESARPTVAPAWRSSIVPTTPGGTRRPA